MLRRASKNNLIQMQFMEREVEFVLLKAHQKAYDIFSYVFLLSKSCWVARAPHVYHLQNYTVTSKPGDISRLRLESLNSYDGLSLGVPTEWRAELFGGLSRWVFDRNTRKNLGPKRYRFNF